MANELEKMPSNSIDKNKKDVRTYSKVTAVCGTVTGVALLTWIILSTSFLWVVLWGAGALYGTYRVGKAIGGGNS